MKTHYTIRKPSDKDLRVKLDKIARERKLSYTIYAALTEYFQNHT